MGEPQKHKIPDGAAYMEVVHQSIWGGTGTNTGKTLGPQDAATSGAREMALREVLELIQTVKDRYAIFGRPDGGQLDKAMDEVKTRVEAMIDGK